LLEENRQGAGEAQDRVVFFAINLWKDR